MVKKVGKWLLLLMLAAGLVVNLAACGDDDDDGGETEATLAAIEVKTKPTKTAYTVGDESLDPSGLVITEKWTEGKADVDVAYSDETKDSFEFTGFDSTAAAESQTITVKYKDKTTTFVISVSEEDAPATLSSIAIASRPTKTAYVVGDTFDATGLKVNAVYSDGTTAELAADEYTVSTPDLTAANDSVEVTVTLKSDTTKTTTFTISVHASQSEADEQQQKDDEQAATLVSIAVSPISKEYTAGDTFDKSAFTVTATYGDGASKAVTGATFDPATPDLSAATTQAQTITVSYTEGSVTKTATITYTVKAKIVNYTVTFNTNGGSTVSAQTVASGSTATEPTAPTKDGYTFVGWYSDEGLATAYDFTATVTANITLYAKWTAVAEPEPETTVTGTEYAWDFSATDLVTKLAWTAGSGGSVTTTSGSEKVSKSTLNVAATYESTPAGLTLNLAASPENTVFNAVDPKQNNNNVSGISATAGSIEPSANYLLTVSVKGPFKATMLCAANTSSGKSDRYAFIKIGDEEVVAPNKTANTLSGSGETLTYTYTGTDTVTVGFGATNIVRIHDIKITTANGDATGKTAGEVKSADVAATKVEFVNGEGTEITELTLSKAQAVAGYELATSLTPAYATDTVAYSIKEEDAKGISVTGGKVSVSSDYTGNNTVTVVAKANESVSAELSLTVSAEIALTADSVVTVGVKDGSSASIYTDGKTTLVAALDKDYTGEITYEWYVGEAKQESAATAEFEFSNTTAGEYLITAKAVSGEVTTNASEAVKVTVKNAPTGTVAWELSTAKTLTAVSTGKLKGDEITLEKLAANGSDNTLGAKLKGAVNGYAQAKVTASEAVNLSELTFTFGSTDDSSAKVKVVYSKDENFAENSVTELMTETAVGTKNTANTVTKAFSSVSLAANESIYIRFIYSAGSGTSSSTKNLCLKDVTLTAN